MTADKIKELALQLEIRAHDGRATFSIFSQLLTAIDKLTADNKALVEACSIFCEWLDREEAGFVNAGKSRETPEDEAEWREWYYGNIDLCNLAQKKARAALEQHGGAA